MNCLHDSTLCGQTANKEACLSHKCSSPSAEHSLAQQANTPYLMQLLFHVCIAVQHRYALHIYLMHSWHRHAKLVMLDYWHAKVLPDGECASPAYFNIVPDCCACLMLTCLILQSSSTAFSLCLLSLVHLAWQLLVLQDSLCATMCCVGSICTLLACEKVPYLSSLFVQYIYARHIDVIFTCMPCSSGSNHAK